MGVVKCIHIVHYGNAVSIYKCKIIYENHNIALCSFAHAHFLGNVGHFVKAMKEI